MDTVRRDWGASGLAYLTGSPTGPPDFSRAAVLDLARANATQLSRRLGIAVDAAELLTGRAALLGLTRRGRVSAGGATRLLPTRDGWCALTLSRPDDVDAVPALIESEWRPSDPWPQVQRWATGRTAGEVTDRARLLRLPASELGEARAAAPGTSRAGPRAAPRDPRDLLVVDLSSMWAGPLCGQLLRWAGATVVKVESRTRPDGTRAGSPAFFDWLNGGKLCHEADFDDGRCLRTLLEAADVVIESSRPAALGRRGLGAHDVVPRDGRVWMRITGHGADGDPAGWPAFGDDAAVAGGLVGCSADGPVFCADAIADPLTGLHAALCVAQSLARGGGEVIDVAMAAVAATYAEPLPGDVESDCPAAVPTRPRPELRATVPGADSGRVERLIAGRTAAPC